MLIPANSTSATIAVDVTGDNIVETGGETVIVTLLSTNTAVTVGSPDAATVTIADDDASSVSIAATTQANEAGPVDGLFTVTLTNPVSIPTTVTLAVTGTATEGTDYAAIGTTVLIPANSTSATISVPVLNDNIVETGGETVIVTLVSTNTAVTVGSPDAATVTIADDDASGVSIAATTQANEAGPVDGLFTVTLTNPVSIPTTVTLAVTGTATEGTDYAAIGTTVLIPANSTSATIAVDVTGDNIVETGGETVIVTLLSTNTAVTVGSPDAATVTIADDDASEASITATDGAEPSTNGLFTVVLTNPVSIPTTVTYSVGGTATSGTDYTPIGTTVLIPANSTSATISVPVLNDNIVETGGETVIVTLLSTNTAVTVGTPAAATVTIADDDASGVSIAATTQANEAGPVDGLFTVTLTNPVSIPTTVTLAVTGTATEGTDYAAIGTTVLIPANSTVRQQLPSM